MATMDNYAQRKIPSMVWFGLFVAAAFIIANIMVNAHAVQKHGNIAQEICSFKAENMVATTYNKTNNRCAYVVLINGIFGIIVNDSEGNNVTAFPKEKMKSLPEVLRYLKNVGYE